MPSSLGWMPFFPLSKNLFGGKLKYFISTLIIKPNKTS